MGTVLTLADAVLVTTTTTGTGSYAIGSAVTGYFAPADISPSLDGKRVSYVVVDSVQAPTIREIGEGVLSSGSPWTLTRATIRRSLSGGVAGSSAINWSAGTKYLFLSPVAANTPQYDSEGWLTGARLYAGTTGGTSTAYTATATPAVSAYVTGESFFVNLHTACGQSPTLNLNSIGAKNIKLPGGGAPGPGAFQAGPHLGYYDGTNIILTQLGGGPVMVYSAAFSAVSAVSIVLPSGFSFFKFHGFVSVSNDTESVLWRTSVDGGSNYDSGGSDYNYIAIGATAAASLAVSQTSGSSIPVTQSLDSGATSNAVFDGTVYPGDGTIYPRIQISSGGAADSGGGLFRGASWIAGERASATAINAMRFRVNTGTMSGKLVVLGYL